MDIYFILFICWNKITLMQQMAQLFFFFPQYHSLKATATKAKSVFTRDFLEIIF